MSNPFFQMWNKHAESCGEPPPVSNEASKNYYGYFENKHGEQWIFVYDRQKKTGELRGGDIGWGTTVAVIEGKAEMNLNRDEAAWLEACWAAATFA
jgi:hypothetical protein